MTAKKAFVRVRGRVRGEAVDFPQPVGRDAEKNGEPVEGVALLHEVNGAGRAFARFEAGRDVFIFRDGDVKGGRAHANLEKTEGGKEGEKRPRADGTGGAIGAHLLEVADREIPVQGSDQQEIEQGDEDKGTPKGKGAATVKQKEPVQTAQGREPPLRGKPAGEVQQREEVAARIEERHEGDEGEDAGGFF